MFSNIINTSQATVERCMLNCHIGEGFQVRLFPGAIFCGRSLLACLHLLVSLLCQSNRELREDAFTSQPLMTPNWDWPLAKTVLSGI